MKVAKEDKVPLSWKEMGVKGALGRMRTMSSAFHMIALRMPEGPYLSGTLLALTIPLSVPGGSA
jgi:hypothetical protein